MFVDVLKFKCSGIDAQGQFLLEYTGYGKQGIAYGWHRYAGPKPPKGKSHLYRFILKKAEGHILQKGEITGEFIK